MDEDLKLQDLYKSLITFGEKYHLYQLSKYNNSFILDFVIHTQVYNLNNAVYEIMIINNHSIAVLTDYIYDISLGKSHKVSKFFTDVESMLEFIDKKYNTKTNESE